MGDRRSRFREDRDGEWARRPGVGLVVSSVEISVRDGGRMSGVKYIAERWYAMMVKSMGSRSVCSGRKEVNGEMSWYSKIRGRARIGDNGELRGEGRRCGEECGEELG